MSYFVIDVETDGRQVGKHSMVCFGIVFIDKEFKLDKTFYGQTAPITELWIPESLKVSGFTREEHLKFPHPKETMMNCYNWIKETNTGDRPLFLSDNNGFDFQWMDWYFWEFCNENPFGHTSTNLNNVYQGMIGNMRYFKGFKYLRKTRHTHHPIDDARGSAEAFVQMIKKGLKTFI